MTPNQITALAREYAESRYPEAKTDEDDFLYDSAVYVMEDNLRWLLRRFCLVEKKDVEAKYQEAKERYFNPDDEIEKTMYGGRMSMLEYLFPEIAKEVEG